MISTMERKQYEKVAKMTGFELAQIEADELHPLHQFACDEIDARNASNNKRHALDAYDEQDAWDRSFAEAQERDHFEHTLDLEATRIRNDDEFVAAAGFVDPEEYSERINDMYA